MLEHFYAEVKDKQGEDYEPESLKVMMALLDRHLTNKGYIFSIVRDREYLVRPNTVVGGQSETASPGWLW